MIDRSPRRQGLALPLVLACLAVLIALGLVGWFRVSNTRSSLERLYARRILDITANSAFEEACARLEEKLSPVPVPTHGQQRNLQDMIGGEQVVEVELLKTESAPDNVIVGPVKIRSGKWVLDDPPHSPAGPVKISEIGIVELEVDIKVQIAGTKIAKRVTARRYAWAAPPVGAATGGQCRIAVQSYNVVYQMKEL